MELSPPRGTRDAFPDQMRLRMWLFGHFREVARQFGFEEYDAPVVEHQALYTRKAGEEIVDQLYTFEDKGGRMLALRPEMTPSLARMILQKGNSLSLPVKWFSLPQCWRYERMTRGRKREHFQWNMDIFGVAHASAEVELLAAVRALFVRLGLDAAKVGIRISDRQILQALMRRFKVNDERFASVCVAIDKFEKLPAEAVQEELQTLGFSAEATRELQDVLRLTDLSALQKFFGAEGEQAVGNLWTLLRLAEGYDLGDWLTVDVSVVRGLAYYTGTVFEAFDRHAKLRAICGGGRYDRLLSTFGGRDRPACGFGFGDVVILELLSDHQLLPDLGHPTQDVVVSLAEELRPVASGVASDLRAQGRAVDLVLEIKRVKWALRHADRLSAERLIVLGPDEFAEQLMTVRHMKDAKEERIPLTSFASARSSEGVS